MTKALTNYDKIKITENGQVFETSDAVLDGYMTRQ